MGGESRLMDRESSELLRKIVHLSFVFVIPIDALSHAAAVCLSLAFLAVYLGASVMARRGRKMPLLAGLIGVFSRRNELASYRNPPLFFAVAIFMLIAFAPGMPAYIGIVSAAIGDTFSMLFGKALKGPTLTSGKTAAGFLGFFLSTSVVLFFVLGPQKAMLIALVGSVAELVSHRYDNLTVPFATAVAAMLVL